MIRRVLAPRIDFGALRRELGLPESFPAAAQREADKAASASLPAVADRTAVPFVTVDPATSRDLDQAMHLSRRPGGGFRVRYAIADVATHVCPGGALEEETWRRGQTVYLPDGNVPLHPHTLSEGAASLLPDADRAAVLWTIDLDADGGTVAVALERARVRSRVKLDYVGVQFAADAGRLPEPIALLPEIGALLTARGLRRGAINLPLPEQDVEPDGDGWRLVLRGPGPMEDHNAQISLLTGMAAADIMLAGRIGLLRTMPAPRPEAVERLRLAAGPLGVHWPAGMSVGEVLAGLDPAQPRAAAFIDQAAELMRGAAYTAFDGELPERPEHGGVAAAYAHVTAPLRRLADRYATEICLALHEGREVPEWARAALPKLPEVMASTDRTASAATRGAVELAEAVLLSHRVGETFEAAVLDVDAPRPAAEVPRQPGTADAPRPAGQSRGGAAPDRPAGNDVPPARPGGNGEPGLERLGGGAGEPVRSVENGEPGLERLGGGVSESVRLGGNGGGRAGRPGGNGGGRSRRPPGGTIALDEPPVRARCLGELPLGERVAVRLVTADPRERKVLFERA